jgi:hypothetical protein
MEDSFQYLTKPFSERIFMEPTKVTWSLGYTLNTGNFQNLRLDCQISDWQRDGESAKEASDRVYKFVEDQLTEKLNQAKEELA